MYPFFIPNQGRDILNGDSFRSRLIARIVSSTKHFISIRDIRRVEKGLVTLLRVVGYISGDFVHLLFSYFQIKFPNNYAVTASHLYTLKPRHTQFFDVGLLDMELLLCAFKHRNATGINQMLLRLESNGTYDLSMIRTICALGIPGLLNPSNQHRSHLEPNFFKEHRMAAQAVVNTDTESAIIQILGQEIFEAATQNCNFECFNLLQAPWSQVKKFIFVPGFDEDYTDMVAKLFTSGLYKSMPVVDVLERLAILTCLRIFNCPPNQLDKLLQNIYSELLCLRISVRGIPATNAMNMNGNEDPNRVINQVEIFSQPTNPLLSSIRLLLEE